MTLPPTAPAPGFRCPRCGGADLAPDDDTGLAVCPACGHRAPGELVAEAVWLRGERRRLETRLTWVEQQLAGGGEADAGQTLEPTAGHGARATRPAGTGTAGSPVPMTAQTLLLGGGAVLLVVASVVFAAVAWDRLGAWGQLGLLALVVGALASAAHGLRHSYRSTAQTLAGVAAAVAAVGLVAAPRLGLGGPDAEWLREHDAAWGAVAMLAVAGLGVALARVSGLTAWRYAAVAATVLAGLASCLAASPDGGGPAPLAVAALVLVGAVVLWSAGRVPAGGGGPARHDLVRVGVGLIGVGLVLALPGYADPTRYGLWAVTWGVVAAAGGLLCGAGARPAPAPVLRVLAGVGTAHAAAFAAAAVVATGWGGVHVLVVLLALLGAAALVATTHPLLRRRDLTGAATSGAATLWLLALPLLLSATYVRSGLGSYGYADRAPATTESLGAVDVAVHLAVVAASLFAVAVLDARRQALAWLGAVGGTVAAWVLWGDQGVDRLEAFTLSGAALLLAAGLVVLAGAGRDEHPTQPGGRARAASLVVLGPALSMALLPEAVVSVGEALARDDPTRAVVTIAVSALVSVGGALLHLRAPLLVGLAAAVVAAVGQVYSVSDLVPRWVVLALGGAALLAAGFSVEALSRAGRRAWRYADGLR